MATACRPGEDATMGDGPAKARATATSLLWLSLGGAVALFCGVVIVQTAQLPSGDGSGMQWVVVVPLGLLFGVVGAPALILGVYGLKGWHSPEAAREGRRRAFRRLWWSLGGLVAALFVLPAVLAWMFSAFD